MPLNEVQTRYNLIDPAIKQRRWTDDLVKMEEPTHPNIIHDKGAEYDKITQTYMYVLGVTAYFIRFSVLFHFFIYP
jgi:hypothetical protein